MNTTDSPAVLQLRVDLWNIRYYLDHTEPGQHREEIDEAVKKVFKRWDRVNEEQPSQEWWRNEMADRAGRKE